MQRLSIVYAPVKTDPASLPPSLILSSLYGIVLCPIYPRERNHDINLTTSLSEHILYE